MYKRKQEHIFTVLLQNIHPSTNTETLKKAIEEHKYIHTITNISNIRQILKNIPSIIFWRTETGRQ